MKSPLIAILVAACDRYRDVSRARSDRAVSSLIFGERLKLGMLRAGTADMSTERVFRSLQTLVNYWPPDAPPPQEVTDLLRSMVAAADRISPKGGSAWAEAQFQPHHGARRDGESALDHACRVTTPFVAAILKTIAMHPGIQLFEIAEAIHAADRDRNAAKNAISRAIGRNIDLLKSIGVHVSAPSRGGRGGYRLQFVDEPGAYIPLVEPQRGSQALREWHA